MKIGPCLRRVHQVSGLVCGLIFFVLCATGGLYLFRDEIERLTDRHRYFVDDHARCATRETESSGRYSLDALLRVLEKRYGAKAESVFIPADPRRTWRVVMDNGTAGNRRLLYDVDPFTGETTGRGAEKTASFFRGVKRIHTTLGLPKRIGKTVVFVATIVSLAALVSGWFLWFRGGGNRRSFWKKLPGFRLKAGRKRLLFDLHQTVGFHVVLPVGILCVSGLFLSCDPHGKTVASFSSMAFLHCEKSGVATAVDSSPLESPLETVLKTQRRKAPKSDMVLSLPNRRPYIVMRSKRAGFFGSSLATVSYWDAEKGALLAEERFSGLTWKQKAAVLIVPLHYGDFWGTSSKVLYLSICCLAANLPISGLLLYCRRFAFRASPRSTS